MSKNILILALIGLMSGCRLFFPGVDIREDKGQIICDTTSRPDALNLKDTPPTLVMNDAGAWGYWFDAELYAAIGENIQAMRRWMKQSKAINQKLVQCIENHNAQDGARDATLDP